MYGPAEWANKVKALVPVAAFTVLCFYTLVSLQFLFLS